MTLNDVFKESLLLLPQPIPQNESYRSFLYQLFDQYIALLKKVQSVPPITGLKLRKDFKTTILIQEKFIEGIKNALDSYYDGHPAKAYTLFSDVMQYRKRYHKHIFNNIGFKPAENFYRIRIKEENFPLSSLEMFHIPFHSRGRVKTQRYSIPGFPSLYLAKTLYVAWEEMNRPSLNNFQVVRLQSKEKINVLDLTTSDWGTDNLNKSAYKYLMTWPLIAACSIKVKDYSDFFKSEYIIPQLLLQWVRNTGDVDGIKYGSTHIDKKELIGKGDLYNVVLPVKDNEDHGYCKRLTTLFDITETVSKQLWEYSSGGKTFLYTKKETDLIDLKIPELEIIKGKKFPYSYSVLGRLEMMLDAMPVKPIK